MSTTRKKLYILKKVILQEITILSLILHKQNNNYKASAKPYLGIATFN